MPAGRRLLLRAPKDTFEVASPEQTVAGNLIATNGGNLVFLGAAQKVLSVPGVAIDVDRLRVEPSAAGAINERYDAYVIPLANAFRPRYQAQLVQLTKLIRRLTIPVSILGVGVDGTVDGDTSLLHGMTGAIRDFVAAVLDRGPSIGVRGEITADYVRRLGFRDVDVIGCPSMFLHGPSLHVAKRTPVLVAEDRLAITVSPYVAAMGPILQRHAAAYPNLTYVAQDIDTLAMLVLGTPVDGATAGQVMPRHPDHPLVRDGRTRQYVDPWPWIADLRAVEFVFGSRIHGAIAGLLAGTPAYLLAHDARTIELARYFEIPHRTLRDTPADVDAAALYAHADLGPLVHGHAARFDRFARYLAAHGLEHAFDHPGAAEAFDQRVAATPYPPAVTAASAARDRAQGGVRGVASRLRIRARRRLQKDDVKRLRARAARLLTRVRDTSAMQPVQPARADPPPERRLRVGNEVNRLADVRAFVRDSVAGLGGSRRVADDLVQAVDEAACNVMVHGYGGAPGEIEIEATRLGDAIQIRLLDRSTPFDPTAAPRPDPATPPVPKRPGGMGVGIELLRTMTDEVRHHVRPDGGNELTLVRSIDGPAEEG